MSKIVVYMLHFEKPVGRARHYVGSAEPHAFRARLRRHKAGTGAALTSEAVKRGIGMRVAHIWTADSRAREQEIKAAGKFSRHCVYCQAERRGQPFPPAMEVPKCDPSVSPLSWSA